MKSGIKFKALVAAALLLPWSGFFAPAGADDGPMVRHPVSRTPDFASEHAQLSMMQFYVDATRASGELTTIYYYSDLDGDNKPDGEAVDTRELAKPLIVSYNDEVPEESSGDITIQSGVEVGPEIRRDAFVAFSLDDGLTWKQVNVSDSANSSSISIDLPDGETIPYPGDVPEVVHAVAGNQILVAWTSKYCDQGSPRYSIKDDLDADGDGDTGESLYPDLFDVAGSQKEINYTEWMHHGTYPYADVGIIPYSCVWTARGTLEQVAPGQGSELTDPVWGIRWRKAERLTSGKRDAYRVAVDGVEGAGFTVVWQEDPEGLRPGYGEGPGIGWSGATVNHKTDIWYSHIGAADFPIMQDPDGNPTLDPSVIIDTNKPKVFERMSMPVRVTDNYNCLSDRVDSDGNPSPGFCFEDFNGNGTADLCSETYPWTNSKGVVKNICVTEDGRLLNGQIGASRPRMELQGYRKPDGSKSAWVILTYEETKGLGAGHTDEEPLDIGKDTMYHSFDMFTPEIAAPGHMLNMPETDPTSDPENPTILPLVLNDKAEYQYQTSIGRRPSLIVQPGGKIAELAAIGETAGLTSAFVLYKDGYERQGGPSDIFMRRLVIPAGFDPAVDNPYDVKNLACDLADTAIVTNSPSAYPPSAYPNGVCLKGAVNISGTTPLTFDPLDNGTPSHGITERVLTWEQTIENLDDVSWVNKYDVAKGHRGFIDGNFVMVMYAWSPNWLATSHGHEPYNLYIRRSFDGGLTWTTTPSALGGTGTTYDQVNGVGDLAGGRLWTETRILGPGEFEPARNVSQITTNKETVLDPRYSPTNIGTQSEVYRVLNADGTFAVIQPYPEDDMRDPSKFFAVYETGDATTIELGGEADPLDLFYSRATIYGDFWDSEDVYAQGRGEFEERWDWLEKQSDVLSGEASIAASPGGAFMWAVWNQWMEDGDHVFESDPMFRRLWWDDLVILVADAGMYEAQDGDVVTLDARVDYNGEDSLEDLIYEWDLDSDGVFETLGQTVELVATGALQGVAVRICDSVGYCDIDQGWINPGIHLPRVWKVQAAQDPELPRTVHLTARFVDPGPDDTNVATIDWGDGTSDDPAATESDDGKGVAFVTGSHAYAEPGLYTIRVTLTDDDGHAGWDDLEFLGVYDQSAGTVEGLLTFDDPNGAGVANLEVNARYWNSVVPVPDADPTTAEGMVKFSLGDIDFEARNYEYMVITPEGVVYLMGRGSLNGKANHRFLISGVNGKSDLIRVRIYDHGLNENLIYDSQPGDVDAVPVTEIKKGKLTIEDN